MGKRVWPAVEREGECRKYPTGALSARQGWRVRHARNFHSKMGREGEEENDCPYLLDEAKHFIFPNLSATKYLAIIRLRTLCMFMNIQ